MNLLRQREIHEAGMKRFEIKMETVGLFAFGLLRLQLTDYKSCLPSVSLYPHEDEGIQPESAQTIRS